MGLVALLLPGFFVLPMLVVFYFPELLDDIRSINIFLVLVIASLVVVFVFVPRWLGFKRVVDQGAGEQVAAQIRKIERGQVAGFTAAVVLRCSPASWRTVVKRAQQLSALIVIEVTDLSENVLWELETAVRLKAPQKIVLAHRIEAGKQWALPPLCVTKILERVEARTLEAIPVFLYPGTDEQLPEFEQPPIDGLHHILARALLQSDAAKATSLPR